jgi:protein-S-isoprenylcysteine O-methyltransferase Ste14
VARLPRLPGLPGLPYSFTTVLAEFGGWLFRHRTVIPMPIALLLVLIPPTSSSVALVPIGLAMLAGGESLRLLAVRHIGAVSRTRTDRLGPLVASGPFRWVRNPLYIGNVALWVGLVLVAQLPWLAVPVALLLALEYHAIVRWEEQLLESRLGEPYRSYVAAVPRWLPRPPRVGSSAPGRTPFNWSDTLFSERGTLAAIVAGLVLLWLKAQGS